MDKQQIIQHFSNLTISDEHVRESSITALANLLYDLNKELIKSEPSIYIHRIIPSDYTQLYSFCGGLIISCTMAYTLSKLKMHNSMDKLFSLSILGILGVSVATFVKFCVMYNIRF
jgi:hypothetical protein